jgi:mannose-6-phosphate isomerase-like protein (cupin superfamily)
VPGYQVKRIDDMESIALGSFKRARAELDVNAFGMQVMDLPPNNDLYPEHDHADDGMEEVYVALKGRGEIDIEGERHELGPDTMISVKPGVSRKVYTGEEALRLLIVGGIEGKPYEAPEVSKLGAPDEFTEGIIEQLEAKGVDVTELREQMQAQLA